MDVDSEHQSDFKTTKVFKTIEPYVDLGALLIEDLDPFNIDKYKSKGNKYLKALARDNVQYLFNKIWELPTERVEDAIVVKLPDIVTKVPREKPIPRLREATRWERFAKLKGIENKKKSRMMWSDETQSWQPSWGYKRAKDDTKNWVVEIPIQKDPYKDYIGERMEQKKEKVAKNELHRLRNIHNEMSKREETLGMPIEQKSAEQLGRQIKRGTEATASLGKFTPRFKDEKAPKNTGKKRQFMPNENNIVSERDKQLNLFNRLQSKVAPIDIEKAAGHFVQEEQANAKNSGTGGASKKPLSRSLQRKKSRAQKPGSSKKPGGPKLKGQTSKRNRKTAKK